LHIGKKEERNESMLYRELSAQELSFIRDGKRAAYEEYKKRGCKLDISRGKPSADLLDLSEGLLSPIPRIEYCTPTGEDYRNYCEPDGIPEMRRLFSDIFEIPYNNVIVGGNSSLQLMYDCLCRALLFGFVDSKRPWVEEKNRKWLCITPGYDRHFAITEKLGFELVSVPMKADGPDMDIVEELVKDSAVKGIWCVPKYSNPTGNTYSDEVVRRLCRMKTAAPDFRIMWDNAYAVHDFDDDGDKLLNIVPEAIAAGHENRVFCFGSTSKITYPGGGIAMIAASEENLNYLRPLMHTQIICYDKLNQLRHVRYLKDKQNTVAHMRLLGGEIKKKFETAKSYLAPLKDLGILEYTDPKGGYFISVDLLPGCASRVYNLAKEAGVTLTKVGATFPYGKDPEDKNLRLAVTFTQGDELKTAMEILSCVICLVSAEHYLQQ